MQNFADGTKPNSAKQTQVSRGIMTMSKFKKFSLAEGYLEGQTEG
jgi:hypothetical protein